MSKIKDYAEQILGEDWEEEFEYYLIERTLTR